MGLSFTNIAKKIGDVLGGVERQVNPFDHGATYANPTPTRPVNTGGVFTPNTTGVRRITSGPVAPVRPNKPTVVRNVLGGDDGNQGNDYRSIISKLWDQANPLDNGRTITQPKPQNTQKASAQLTGGLQNHFVKPVVDMVAAERDYPIATTVRRVAAEVTHNKQAAQNANIGDSFKKIAPPNPYLQDAKGQVIKGTDGKPKNNPAYSEYLQNIAAGMEGGVKVKAPVKVASTTKPVVKTTGAPKAIVAPTQVKELPSGKVSDQAAARQAVIDAHNPVDNNVPVAPREGKIMGEGGFRDSVDKAIIDTDAAGINTLRHIEKSAGVTGHVATFLHNTNMLRRAPAEAQRKWFRDPHINAAIGGLDKTGRAEFADYAAARAELNNYDGLKTSRTPAENQAIVNKYHAKYGDRFAHLNNYYREVITPQAVADGRMTAEEAAHYSKNDNYVHISRNMEDLATNPGQGKSLGLGKSRVRLGRKGSERAIHDPVAASLEYAKQMETEHWKNVTGTHLVDTLFRHGQATKLVDSEHVLARQQIRKFLSDTREGKKVVDRTLKTMGRKLRVTQREVDALNKEGLDISLKPRVDTRTAPNVKSRVKVTRSSDYTKVVGELKKQGRWKPTKASSVAEAKTALKGGKWYNSVTGKTTAALKSFAERTGMTEEEALVHQHMKAKGVDAYINAKGKEVPVNIAKLERHAGKMASEGRFDGKVEDVRASVTKMGIQNTKRAVEHLLSVEPTELARIKAKIATREPKLAALIDHVQKLRDESEAFHTARRDAYNTARGIQDKATTNKNTITIQRNGAREVYEVSKEMKNLAAQLKPFELGLPGRIGSIPARLLRGGATAINPVFAAANPVKDLVSSAILSKDATATHTPSNIVHGLGQSAKNFVGAENHPLWHEFEGVGGDMTQFDLTRNLKGTNEIIERVAEGRKAGAKQAAKHWLRTLEDANSITEKATRFQNFKGMYESTLRKAGLDEGQVKAAVDNPTEFAKQDPQLHEAALMEARTGALENTINFNRAGSWGRMINLAIPYSNAAIQGGRQLVKTTRDRPGQTIGKGAAWVGAPIAAATLWNTADPERKKVYENIDEYEKQNNLIWIVPGTKKTDVKGGNYNVVKIPLPPDIGAVFQPVRQAIEAIKHVKDTNHSPGNIAGELGRPFTGPVNVGSPSQMVGSVIPQAIKPGIQQAANTDFYTGKKIVPKYLEDAHTKREDRSYTYTSNTAKAIAKLLHAEPVRIDKFVKDMFGTAGTMTVNTTDNAAHAIKDRNPKEIFMAGPDAVGPGFVQRFSKASSKTDPNNEAAAHFAKVDVEYQKLDKNEKRAYDTIHPTKVDGNAPDKSFYDPAIRAELYKKYPKLLDAENKINKDNGDPFFKIPKPQQDVILTLDTLKTDPGNNSAKKIAKDNPWLQDYYDSRGKFFDQLAASGKLKTPTGSKLPQAPIADKNTQSLLDQYGKLPSDQKSAFITSNPSVSDYFAANDQYERIKRGMMGLPQFDAYPKPDANLQKKLDVYNSLPKHDGKKGGNASRYAFIQANPEISDYFNKASEYGLIKDAQIAIFEGEELSDKSQSKLGGGSSSSSSSSSSYKPYVRYGSSGSGRLGDSATDNPLAHTISQHGKGAGYTSRIQKPSVRKAKARTVVKPKVSLKKSR